MSTSTSIATRNAAEDAVSKAIIAHISSTDFNREDFRKFKRSALNAARAVPSSIGGGAHGHIFLLEDAAAYIARTGVGYTEAVRPGPVDYTGATTNAQIARVKDTRLANVETFNTQEGVRTGLRKAIIANVPAELLVVHEDPDSGLDEVEPRVLLATIEARAAPVTSSDAKTLKTARDKPLVFDTDVPLATQFAVARKSIADLRRVHNIATSETELMMEWTADLEKEKDFEEQVAEFRARTVNNTFGDFITFFAARDVEVRQLNKLVPGRAKAQGYHSAANISELEDRLGSKIENEVANLATAIETAMNASACDSGATEHTITKDETAANVADRYTSAASNQNEIIKALKDLQDRLGKMENSGGGRRRRGRGGGNGSDGGDGRNAQPSPAGEERKPCKHCGKRHKVPDDKCWKLEANKDNRPKNYVAPADKADGN